MDIRVMLFGDAPKDRLGFMDSGNWQTEFYQI